MTDSTCVFAWTATDPYVYYQRYVNLSINDGKIVLTVRGPEKGYCQCGPEAIIELPRDQAVELRSKLFEALLLTQP